MKISIISGLKYNYVNNHTTSRYESLPSDISGYASTSAVTEHNPQAYVSFSRKIARFTLNAGVRYQFDSGSGGLFFEKQTPDKCGVFRPVEWCQL